MSRRRRDKRVWFVALGAFIAIFLFTFLTQKFKGSEDTEAASLAGFDPGYIISDYQMSNYNSMSEVEIQNFLKQKGNCNDTRTYLAGYYPNLHYHIKDGHFVCLADETFGDGTAYGESAPGGASAAHIIWQAAQDYKINPQVLIVLLQKEQGLITDSWPNDRQYKTATGYGCPDTAPCSSQYYGFKNQVRKAAALFRTVLDGGWTNYPLGNNYIQYNPNADCGGSVVNIRSLATSALYRYTPYQPNAGALAAGYGTAYCGAYGNRNFYLYFQDWFGGIIDEVDNFETAIAKKYAATKSIIGESTSEINCNIGHEGACVQAYQNGVIIYSPETGAWENYGEIRKKYIQQGTVDGKLGFPITGVNCNIGYKGACVQAYQNGVIIYSPETGAWENYGEIRQRYINNGSIDGVFGFPISGVEEKNGVTYQKFQNKTMMRDEDEKYWITSGDIIDKYIEKNEKLGLPIMNINCNIGHEGACVQAYEEGVIIYSPETGAWENYGEIRKKYIESGSVDGRYGFPIKGIETKNDVLRQEFQNGIIN